MIRFVSIVASFTLNLCIGSMVHADTLIVGNKNEHTVSFIDLDTGEEVRRVETGRSPHEIAVSPDGRQAVVVSYREQGYLGNTLHVFDVTTGAKTKVIDLGPSKALHGLKWIGDTDRVAVTAEESQHLTIVDIKTGEVIKAISTDANGSHMVALSPDLSRAYTGNIGSGSFSVIDLETLELIKNVKAGEGTEAITVTPDGTEIWVGNNGSRSVMVFDAKTYAKTSEIKTEGIPIRVEVSPNGAYVAVSEADKHNVLILDTASREITASINLEPVGGMVPVTMLWSETDDTLWVAATYAARIIEIDTKDWSVERILNAGEGSDGLGWSPVDTVINASDKTDNYKPAVPSDNAPVPREAVDW